ncbi:MAG: YiiX/YebB-like N1pC/P60 family cysteine hydrolase [Bdellovibrionota bacterium]
MRGWFIPWLGVMVMMCASCVHHVPGIRYQRVFLESGDLVFLDINCGDLCDGIEDVTLRQFHVVGPRLSHVGILFEEDGRWWVYEAWTQVQKVPLKDFLLRVNGDPTRWFVARSSLGSKEKEALHQNVQKKLGAPYDDFFLKDNGKYYCSELIADIFSESVGKEYFPYLPMFYGVPNKPSDPSWRMWSGYFASKGMPVPQNKPGVSPLGIYLSPHLTIIK